MSKGRVEAFSDGVMAIVITILVLGIVPPKGDSLQELIGIEGKLLVYLFSFVVVAVYWNNHHHLFQVVEKVNGRVLWANNFFLFSLTLFPFASEWLSNHMLSLYPHLLFGLFILFADVMYWVLLRMLDKEHSCQDTSLIKVDDKKTRYSIVLNVVALLLGYWIHPLCVAVVNLGMILLWVMPNKKIENSLKKNE